MSTAQWAGELGIDVEAANELLKAGSAYLLDVPEEREYRRRHVPGAVLVPLNTLVGQTPGLPNDRRILVICEHGNRSLVAARYLRSRGFDDALSVRRGTVARVRGNLPVDQGQAG